MAFSTAGEEGQRNSPLPTIQESEEDLNDVLEDVLQMSRRKKEHKTPSKRDSIDTRGSVNIRQRTPRHCAEQAREKITTFFNPGDKYSKSIYDYSDNSSDGNDDTFHPIIDEEFMPKGECKNHYILDVISFYEKNHLVRLAIPPY